MQIQSESIRIFYHIYSLYITDSRYDITSVNFYSENVHEDDIFVRQDILQFFSGESKDYKYLKFP